MIRPVLSVSLAPRSDGEPHEVVELARELRRDPTSIPSAPDYGLVTATPYSFFWPRGYPRPIDKLTPPRTNVTPDKMPAGTAGKLPVGTGVKMMVFDVGLADRAPGVLPNVTTLIPVDNELIDRNGDGLGDYPAIGHGLAIGGTIAHPGARCGRRRGACRTVPALPPT